MRKLVAALACRNKGSRLYGKPLQNLDIEHGVSILDNIIACLKQMPMIDSIVLGVADGVENDVFVEYAQANNIGCIRGDEEDVLERLIRCGDLEGATDIFRTTSESPFLYFDLINDAWDKHIDNNNDATFLDDIIDGCGFEILSLDVLKKSHNEGEDRHRSELCTLYIRENKDKFNLGYITPPEKLTRKELETIRRVSDVLDQFSDSLEGFDVEFNEEVIEAERKSQAVKGHNVKKGWLSI